ncbi:MAG: ribosome-associated translation inhibitor RaiA [Proteobacteria bacterium]|nr:ribosome-associated translation inhibitor RaiA [Pseudomonadota bacterium]
MQLSITGQQLEITDSLRSYITEKMERIERHFDHVVNAHFVLHVQKQVHEAEATLNAPGATIHANAKSGQMYAAIDTLIDKLDAQVRKYKEKHADHHQREGGVSAQIEPQSESQSEL